MAFLEQIAVPQQRGRPSNRPAMRIVRELEDGDLPALQSQSAGANAPPALLKNMRHTHHMLAQALAQGADENRAALISGYAPGTVRALKRDPMFQELMESYKSKEEVLFKAVQQRVASLGLAFVDELQERLETRADSFTNEELSKNAERFLDRTILPSKAAGGNQRQEPPRQQGFQVEFVAASGEKLTISQGGPETPAVPMDGEMIEINPIGATDGS